mmetsp:Transcript_28484/g.69474  ORF Transcript_28484/g.69474 Transcript_28484/m.69474 type:complete len:210 (+) Transcript_28484:183-812(+)
MARTTVLLLLLAPLRVHPLPRPLPRGGGCVHRHYFLSGQADRAAGMTAVFAKSSQRRAVARNRKKKVDRWKRRERLRREANMSRITGNVHRDLLTRDGYRCQYCGARTLQLTIDHVIPRSRGGTTTMGNLVVSCRRCNQLKAARSLTEAADKFAEDDAVGRRFTMPVSGETNPVIREALPPSGNRKTLSMSTEGIEMLNMSLHNTSGRF